MKSIFSGSEAGLQKQWNRITLRAAPEFSMAQSLV